MHFFGMSILGDGRGKKLGFPTLNIRLQTLRYEEGVFAVRGTIESRKFEGIAHFGPRPTFAKNELSVEIHIFNFHQEVSEKTIVSFETVGVKIRDIQKFDSPEKLQRQIHSDCETAKKILSE